MKKVSLACMTDKLMTLNSKDETWIEVGRKHHAFQMSVRMGLNNSYSLQNVMLQVWGGNFTVHVLNV